MRTPKTSAQEATGLWRNLGGYEIIRRQESSVAYWCPVQRVWQTIHNALDR
jgi:hypothetical protein